MTNVVQIETTLGSQEAAQAMAKRLVELRVAACVQVVGPVQSTYWWEESVTTEEEFLLLCKTDRRRVDDLMSAITELHDYDTPEVLVLPVESGNESYLSWVGTETERSG